MTNMENYTLFTNLTNGYKELAVSFNQPYQIKPVERIIFWITSSSVTIESLSLLLLFGFFRLLRTVTNLMVISLTVSDFLNGAVLLPCILFFGLNNIIVQPLIMLVLTSSMGNVCACALDRLVATKYPLLYKSLITRGKCRRFLLTVWIVSAMLAIVPKLTGSNYENSVKFRQIFLGIVLSLLIIASSFLIVVYGYIFKIVRSHLLFIQQQSKYRPKTKHRKLLIKLRMELSHIKRFGVITLTFLGCWLPLIYINFVAGVLLLPHLAPIKLLGISLHTIFLHSAINPILYGFQQKDIRRIACRCFKNDKNRFTSARLSQTRRSHEVGSSQSRQSLSRDYYLPRLPRDHVYSSARVKLSSN